MNSSICGLPAIPSRKTLARQRLQLIIVARALPLLLLLLLTPVKADQFGDFTYTSNGTAITITGYTGAGGAVTIPGTILSLPVTTIGDWAFGNKTTISSVGIPTSVTSIGSSVLYSSSVFYGCTGLTSIAVDPANTAYSSLDGVLFNKEKTVLIQYPGGKAGICSIPASVTFVPYYALKKCIGLTSIIVDPANAYYSSLDEVLFDKTKTKVIQFPGAKTGAYSVPSGVTSIGEAFRECTGLTSVIIPSGVTNIERFAFSGCTRLTGVTMPSSVTSIGFQAFSYCTSLTSVTIPSGVTSILSETFRDCTSLASVTIPSGVTSIGSYAFYYCTSLSSVTIPASVTSIEGLAFYFCTSLTSVTIPASVTSIGIAAFYSCTSLTSVIIPSSVTSIGHSAFSMCTSLTSVTIPASITSIENGTFSSCTSLTSVTIPASVTSISDYAFYGTGLSNSLVSVIFLGNAPTMGSNVFDNADPGFKVYFNNMATGFTTPTWMGYTSVNMGDSSLTGTWLLTNGLPYNADLRSDPNKDGVPLAVEYGLGFNPRVFKPNPGTSKVESNRLALDFSIPEAIPASVRIYVEEATALNGWQVIASRTSGGAWTIADGASVSEGAAVSYRIPVTVRSGHTLNESSARFMRLGVELPTPSAP